MITRLVEIYENKMNSFSQSSAIPTKEYGLREVSVNLEHVIMLRPNNKVMNNSDIKLPKDLHPDQKYTTIYMNRGNSGVQITVVGDMDAVEEKLRGDKKEVLKG